MISIYFVQAARSGAIKCGSSADVPKRLKALQTASADRLELLATFHGSRTYEARLHQILEPFRIHGEWFRSGPWAANVVEAFSAARDVEYLIDALAREAPYFASRF